ncbi:MAG: hypothetical protein ACLUE1_09315, partial [Adlercreutzia equolifaciens]
RTPFTLNLVSNLSYPLQKRVMLMRDITRWESAGSSMLIKAGSAALALALAATLGMVPTAPAWADQTSSENSAIEQPGSVGDDDATGDATEQGEEVLFTCASITSLLR